MASPMSEWQPIVVEMTAYCPCAKCCGRGAHGVTADGTKTNAVWYNFAGDRTTFNFKDEIYVPLGHGILDRTRMDDRVFQVDDRGGALDTERSETGIPRLDLRVRDHWWAVQFGRKRILIFLRRP